MKKGFDFSFFKNDFPAGLVVWLVALPLCLGIAQGSEVDPFAGIIAGIIGGLIVTLFSGSKYGVSGPAAGLITIVVAAVGVLGMEVFFLAVMISGVIQFLLGVFRLGVVGYFIPNSVIKGMLASIGITLILKQIPHGFGVDTDFEGDDALMQPDGESTFSEIGHLFDHIEYGALIIFCISIFIMILWDRPFMKKHKLFLYLPGSLVVVVVGAVLNAGWSVFGIDFSEMATLSGKHLVQLPIALKTHDYGALIHFPDFKGLTNPKMWQFAFTIAIVGSVETLLSVEATDKLDPDKNISPTNKELKAQGIGNVLSGLIGGLPITMVIVRSSANINAQAKTRMSAIYHGLLLLISVFVFPSLLEYIPLAALAGILIILGFKLLKIKNVIETFKKDKIAFISLITTVVAVLATDLLIGVGIGFGVAMFFILRKNYELAFITSSDENETIISFSQIVSFLNKGGLMQTLQKIPDNSKVKISAHKCHTMSSEIVEVIKDFIEITAVRHNIEVKLIGFEKFDLVNQHAKPTISSVKPKEERNLPKNDKDS